MAALHPILTSSVAGDPLRDRDDAAGLVDIPPASRAGRVLVDPLDLRIDADGIWYYQGSPIQRQELVCLFASALRRSTTGAYWLITPAEAGLVEVADVPFLAVEMFTADEGRDQTLSFRTNIDEIVTVDEHHGLYMATHAALGEPCPYLVTAHGLEARLNRAVYYELMERVVEEDVDGRPMFGVWSRQRFFPLMEGFQTA